MRAVRRSRPGRRRALAAAVAAVPLAIAAPAMGADGADRVQVLAKLAPGADAAAVEERTGLRHETTIGPIRWAAYSFTGDSRAAHLKLLRDPGVTRIDFSLPGEEVSMHFTPNDTIFTQPGQVAAGQLTASWNWHWTKTNFPAAWDIARGNGDVKVAVIDSEFDTEHIELKPKLLAGMNFDSGNPGYRTGNVRANPAIQGELATLHGSHVAGLVGAVSDNANGVVGACFDCVVAPYRISLRGGAPGTPETTDAKFVRDLVEALTDISNRDDIRVVNMSLGTNRPHAAMQDAINLALSRGKVLVASAGNNQLDQPGEQNYPASYAGVIGVGATQPDDNIAPFSTNGDFVDVSAPGHGIISTWDQRVPANAQPPVMPPTHGNGFTNLSGTSMASPIVAGLAALMLQVQPDLTAGEVQQLLEQTAVDLGASGKDQVFGAGQIDAFAALQAAQNFERPPGSTSPGAARCGGRPATIVGTTGNDVLRGTSGRDIIHGLGGNDRILGLAGNDILCLGSGNDRGVGGNGTDLIIGGNGKDRIFGGRGNDRLIGNRGNDIIRGNAGNDRIDGNQGNDLLLGDAGRDRLRGQAGRDRLRGGSGNDVAYGGSGRDRIFGNQGNDRLFGNGGNDGLFGASGQDRGVGGPGRDRCVVESGVC